MFRRKISSGDMEMGRSDTQVHDNPADFRTTLKKEMSALTIMQSVSQIDRFAENPKFLLFRKANSSLIAHAVLNAVFSAGFITNVNYLCRHGDEDWPLTILTVSICVSSLILGWILVVCYFFARCSGGNVHNNYRTVFQRLEIVWICLIIASHDIIPIALVNLTVSRMNEMEKGDIFILNMLQVFSMVASLCVPTLLHICIKGTSLKYMAACLIGNLCLNTFLIVYMQLYVILGSLFLFSILSGFLLLEYHRQAYAAFVLANQLHHIILENEKLAKDMQAYELRHMIGNVAHDLKTPLSSFVSGVEMINAVVNEIKTSLPASTFPRERVVESKQPFFLNEKLDSIIDTTEDIKNINNFMLMIINRCLDYTKSINGMELIPKMSSVSVHEVIQLPIQCVHRLYVNNNFNIAIQYAQEEIAQYTMQTDKQWLQENLLCLLANALKYSNSNTRIEGKDSVVLRVSLVEDRRALKKMMSKVTSSSTLSTINYLSSARPLKRSYGEEDDSEHSEGNKDLLDIEAQTEQGRGKPLLPLSSSHRNRLYGIYALMEGEETSSKGSGSVYMNSSDNNSDPLVPVDDDNKDRSTRNNTSNKNSPTNCNSTEHVGRLSAGSKLAPILPSLFSFKPPSHNNMNGSSSHPTMMLQFEVLDKGDVITAEGELMDIFLRKTASSRSNSGGTGLGLYSLSKRIEALGGSYGANKRTDSVYGCRFWFSVPYVHHQHSILNNSAASGNSAFNQMSSLAYTEGASQSHKLKLPEPLSMKLQPLQIEDREGVEQDAFGYKKDSEDTADNRRSVRNNPVSLDNPSTHTAKPSAPSFYAPPHSAEENTTSVHVASGSSDSVEVNEPLSILIVDDSPVILKMCGSLLRRKGHLVDTAENGIEAKNVIEQQLKAYYTSNNEKAVCYDVILMDFQMPRMTGMEATLEIRTLEEILYNEYEMGRSNVKMHNTGEVREFNEEEGAAPPSGAASSALPSQRYKIIGFSANSDEYQVQECFKAGMDGFIPKPFTLQTFYETYQRLVTSNLLNSSPQ